MPSTARGPFLNSLTRSVASIAASLMATELTERLDSGSEPWGLEAEQRGHAPGALHQLVAAPTYGEDLRRLLDGQLDGVLGEIVERLELGSIRRAGALPGGAEPAAHRAAGACRGEALVRHERLHAPLVQRPQDLVQADRGPAGLADPLERFSLALLLELVEERLLRVQDLLGGGVLHVDVDAPCEPLGEVAVQLGLEVGHHLARAPHDQALERPALEVLHKRLARVLEVIVLLLLDTALVARL